MPSGDERQFHYRRVESTSGLNLEPSQDKGLSAVLDRISIMLGKVKVNE